MSDDGEEERTAFEWDEAKNAANFAKHGYAFEDVIEVFDDRDYVDRPDRRFDYGEDRIRKYAYLRQILVCVVYTKRGDLFRIISVRTANARERIEYDRGKAG